MSVNEKTNSTAKKILHQLSMWSQDGMIVYKKTIQVTTCSHLFKLGGPNLQKALIAFDSGYIQLQPVRLGIKQDCWYIIQSDLNNINFVPT